MTDWDERFRAGDYPMDPDPTPLMQAYAENFPDGRALDVATGTGRNATFLAQQGHDVEAIDESRVGLQVARENARDRGVDDRIEWLQVDARSHPIPARRYAVITMSFFRAMNRLSDLKAGLVAGGYLFIEHHLRTENPVDCGPSGDHYRLAPNELLHACLDLSVLFYDESIEERFDGERSAVARLLARRSSGQGQTYPERVCE